VSDRPIIPIAIKSEDLPMTSTQLPGVERRLKKNAAQAAYRARRKAEIEASKAEVAKVKAERKAPKAAKAAKATKTSPPKKTAPTARAGESRTDLVLRLLTRAKGASVAEIMEPTGWLPHTTRAFISATLGKKLGHKIESEKDEKRGRVYRIAAAIQTEVEAA
jgi:hypothetical protein